MKKVLLALSAAVMLTGCMSTNTGTNYNDACLQNLQPGVTTKDQVVGCMGKPNHISLSGTGIGHELLVWSYFGTFATPFGGQGRSKSVGMVFDKDGKFIRIVSQSQSNTN